MNEEDRVRGIENIAAGKKKKTKRSQGRGEQRR